MFHIWKELCFEIYLVLHMISYKRKKKIERK